MANEMRERDADRFAWIVASGQRRDRKEVDAALKALCDMAFGVGPDGAPVHADIMTYAQCTFFEVQRAALHEMTHPGSTALEDVAARLLMRLSSYALN